MTESRSLPQWLLLVVIGLVAGFMSGMFGVGGGVLLVPAFIMLLKMDPKLAAGTSLLAIAPVAVVGVVTYAVGGHVDVILSALMAVGALVGAPIGSWLLSKVSREALQWAFLFFLVVVIVSLFLVVPSRDAEVQVSWLSGAGLVVLGVATGVLSGLLGIGGGVVVVPMLVLLFGASDLVAKGSSLLMMIATSLSGTISNIVRKNVDVTVALTVGIAACLTTSLGAFVAGAIPPFAANIAFAVFLVFIGFRMIMDLRAARRRRRDSGDTPGE